RRPRASRRAARVQHLHLRPPRGRGGRALAARAPARLPRGAPPPAGRRRRLPLRLARGGAGLAPPGPWRRALPGQAAPRGAGGRTAARSEEERAGLTAGPGRPLRLGGLREGAPLARLAGADRA